MQVAKAPAAFARGLWRLKALSWLLCACDFWQQIHYLPFLGPPARRAADGGRRGKAWPLEGIFIALRARGLFRCSLFGPPARRAADGGLLGAAAPPRPPLHSPRTTPLGFPYSISPQNPLCTHSGQSCWAFQLPPACEGCASFAAGASSLRSVISLRAAQCHQADGRWPLGKLVPQADGLTAW